MVDHIVYVDAKSKAKNLEELLDGTRMMIIRGTMGRKLPYGRVDEGDVLYLIRNNAEGLIKAKCSVKSVFNSEKMGKDESIKLVEDHQNKLHLTPKQLSKWSGKRYIVLIEVDNVIEVEPFKFDKSRYSTMDDWLSVGTIDTIRK